MSNTGTIQRRSLTLVKGIVRDLTRERGSQQHPEPLPRLRDLRGTLSPHYRPAPWGDRRKAPKRRHGFRGGVALTQAAMQALYDRVCASSRPV